MHAVLLFVGTAAAIVVVDQLSKLAILSRQQGRPEPRRRGLSLRLVLNAARWPWTTGPASVLLWAGALIVLLGTAALGTVRSTTFNASAGALVGGAAGNAIDRLRRGLVVDFIDVGWWPAFNLADVAIVCGGVTVISLILLSLV